METVLFEDLGRCDYQTAWDYQTSLHKALIEHKLANREAAAGTYSQAHHLLFVEHPPVYTLGKSGSLDHLLLTEADMAERGIQFFPINRGGDITFHGLGQIVGYPILDLECFFTDVHRYVRFLEEMVIRTLAVYGLKGYRIEGYTGVWLGEQPPYRKICAIGVHLSRWVTLHGFAFNIHTDLSYFDHIVPCGIQDADKTVTSLQLELQRPVDIAVVKAQLKHHFSAIFDCKLV